MFDMMKIARKIKEARIAKNMTQVNLADAMEVSYQAVSNWERGNSMPDISKLEQLCQVLEISLEELMGTGSEGRTVVKIISRETDGTGGKVTIEELKDVIPIMPPEESREILKENLEDGEKIDFSSLMEIAPFLEEEYLDELVEQCGDVSDIQGLTGLAPFLSKKALNRLADQCMDKMDFDTLTGLAPFLSEENLGRLVERSLDAGMEMNGMIGLYPFLPQKTLRRIADRLMKKGDFSGLQSITPFC